MKNKRNTLTVVLILAAALLFLILGTVFTIAGNQIAPNPDGTVGNSAGNLNNSGLFCEHEGTVYFANTYDGNALYSMSPDESSLTKVMNVPVRNLLAGGSYLYYFRTGTSGDSWLSNVRAANSFNRCKLNGDAPVPLTRDVVVTAQLVNDYLYLLTTGETGPSFYKLKTDQSDMTVLADYEINPACAVDGVIYYNGTQRDHYLYGLNTDTDAAYEIWRGNIWYPCVQGDYVYYLDVSENYRLCRYSLSQNVVEVLTNDRVDCFNVGYGYIYYQANGENASLKCMNADGSNVQVIALGNYTAINMTSQYVYFQEFGNDTATYHSPLGSGSYEEFGAAKTAALEK